MDNMLGEKNNLKDSTTSNRNIALRDNSMTITYTKTNKLITALFMVTDIMDREEPLRNKLRILGTNIISDIHQNPTHSDKKIAEILSFLDISFSIGMMSEMNLRVLKKEFIDLQQSVREFTTTTNPIWLEDFMKDESIPQIPKITMHEGYRSIGNDNTKITNNINSIGHLNKTRIGVQKASTLMKALKDISLPKTLNKTEQKVSHISLPAHNTNQSYDILKAKRRAEVISIIKNKLSVLPDSGGATITDIKNSAEGPLVSCGEKTLQRELISMVHDGVLKKTGEKRWSKYFI